jgi:hypothetical protein
MSSIAQLIDARLKTSEERDAAIDKAFKMLRTLETRKGFPIKKDWNGDGSHIEIRDEDGDQFLPIITITANKSANSGMCHYNIKARILSDFKATAHTVEELKELLAAKIARYIEIKGRK